MSAMTDPAAAPAARASNIAIKTEIVLIGAGQAGLSTAYHLVQRGLKPGAGFIILDQAPEAGGAWQYRWPSLTLSTVNRIHDLPGMAFAEALDTSAETLEAAAAVPRYFAAYEARFGLNVARPVEVKTVTERNGRFRIETDRGAFAARGLVNATGTWTRPYIPDYPGQSRFRGRQLHTQDYRTADAFAGQHVVIVGGGISAIQLLDEISQVTTTTWVTRREPVFADGPFDIEQGRAAVAQVEARVRAGLPPNSVVSVTGLHMTPRIAAMRDRGALARQPMFSEITETGIRWADGREQAADVLLWCTGFRSALDHLAPLGLREETGGITMTGRLATEVAKDKRIHLVGYGPSASTIGANRAGAVAARELMETLGL